MSGRTYTSSSHSHSENKHLYQQKERDIETDPEHNPSTGTYGESGGLDYFEARFYDSEIARFTTVDPHGNRYTHINGYASMNNNPINMIDPTGMDYIFGQHTPGEFEIQNAITLKDEEYEAMGMQGTEMSRIDIVNDDGEIISSTNVNDGKFDIITYGPLGVPIIQRNALNHQQHIADLVREYGYDAVNEKYYGEPSLGLHGPQGIQPLLFGFDFIFEEFDKAITDILGGLGASERTVAMAQVLLAIKRMDAKGATAAAKKLGFKKTNYLSHGQPVFKKGNRYITPDVDGHNVTRGWKMADSPKNFGPKTRLGTYDENLNWIKK